MFLGKEYLKKYNNYIISLKSMFAEYHKLILGDWFPSFGGNFSENMKLRRYLTLFMYVVIRHFVCYEAEINQSEPRKNFSKLLDNL